MSKVLLRQSITTVLAAGIATLALAQESSQPADPAADPLDTALTGPRTDAARIDPATGHADLDRRSMKESAAKVKTVSAQSFANEAAVIGKAEIELGQLALKNSKDPDIQKYAQRMITDHTNVDKQLQGIAAEQGLPLPKTLDPEHQALKEKLSALRGPDFDREYAKAMAKGHDKAVALFQSASQTSEMPAELRQFASTTLTTLKDHRDMAHALKKGEGLQHRDADTHRS